MRTNTQSIKVWDPIVRIGHWTLVIAFFTAYFTEDELMTQHIWAGYVVGSVVIFRIFWGLVGSKHAKFKDFIYHPSTIFAYLKGLAQRKPQHYLGHNPAGGIMVIALLTSLSITVYSGLALYAVEENAGPFARFYGANMQSNSAKDMADLAVISSASADEDKTSEDESKEVYKKQVAEINNSNNGIPSKSEHNEMINEQDEEFWEDIHEFFANLTLLLVVLHVGGVILSSYAHKENLLKAMITGHKEIK